MKILAGEELYNQIQEAKRAQVRHTGAGYDSEQLCKFQEKMARFVLGAQVVKSIYGYSVRYDSGLQNWGLIASAKSGSLDGSLEAAIKFVEDWVALSPSSRYAWISEYDLSLKDVV